MKRTTMLAASLLAMAMVSGCKREAGGQVVAVVNGDEITVQELNAELATLQVPKNVDVKDVQRRVLQRMIDRRLIAAAAREDGVDKEQDFLIRQRQVNDALLATLLGQRTEKTFRIPDTAAINKFTASMPNLFGQRTVYSVDRILFAPPANMASLQQLKDDHSMDAVAAKLTAIGIPFTRATQEVDSGALPQEVVARIKSLPPTEPILLPQQGSITILVITGSRQAPLAGEEARPLAVQLMRKQAMEQAVEQRLKAQRASAKIEYQPGYAPVAAPAAKPGKS